MVEFRLARYSEVPQIQALYAEAGYGGGISEKDTAIVAAADEHIIGAVRLCFEEGVTVLRGMQVRETFQRQGIGSELLQVATSHLDCGISFCLPYSYLEKFYTSVSFETVSTVELPESLKRRMSSYLVKGQDVIAMRRYRPNPILQPTPSARLS